MNKGVKFRAYPNKEQQNLINRTLGCCRLIYNKGLAMRSVSYSNGEKIGYNQTSAMLTSLKKQADFAFLKDVDSIALQQSLRNVQDIRSSRVSIITTSHTEPSTRAITSVSSGSILSSRSSGMSKSNSPWKSGISIMSR